MLLLVLMVALLSACGTTPVKSAYQVTMPTLDCKPLRLEHEGRELIVLCWQDYARIVRELKGACLALGGTPHACLAE